MVTMRLLLPKWHWQQGIYLSAGDVDTRLHSLGQEDPLKEEMATHFRILAWRIPWTEEPGYSP